MYSIRPIAVAADGRVSPDDAGLLASWYESRGGLAPTREMLPGCGAVCEFNGTPIAAAFLYLDGAGSGLAWLAWLATRPGESAHRAGRAVRHLLIYLREHARSLNYWLLVASYHHPSLLKLLKRLGFQTGDRGMTQLFSPI